MRVILAYAEGQVTEERMDALLAEAELSLRKDEEHGILLKTEGSTGYDMGIRRVIITWLKDHSDVVKRFAVVSQREQWGLLVSIMAPIIDVEMQCFDHVGAAEKWLS